jgi:hypothetical protein
MEGWSKEPKQMVHPFKRLGSWEEKKGIVHIFHRRMWLRKKKDYVLAHFKGGGGWRERNNKNLFTHNKGEKVGAK